MGRRPSKRRLLAYLLCALLAVSVIFEEIHFARIRNLYRNYYTSTVFGVIRTSRFEGNAVRRQRIAILSVLKDGSNDEEYRLAQQSFECYARHHRYIWKVADLSKNATLRQLCPHDDFMFARHCVAAVYLTESMVDWVLFVDADMGVINPNHLIEEWITPRDVHLIFYNRIFNYEIMAGSYLAKNTNFARNFLHYWADYESKLPSSTHGTDNGAIHNVFMEKMTPEKIRERRQCERLWNASRSYEDLYIYEACARAVLGRTQHWPHKAAILKKGKAWARDTWLTNSMWSPRDFVLHGWQKRKRDSVMFASWPSPFASDEPFNMSLCTTPEAGRNWRYKDSFMRDEDTINAELARMIRYAEERYTSDLAEARRRLKNLNDNVGSDKRRR